MSAGKEDSGMSISKYNSEDYPDPTAHGALEIIEQEEHALRALRPIVYICSPYTGDIEANMVVARIYSRFAVDAGYIPIAPHMLSHNSLMMQIQKNVSLACSSETP